MFKFTHILNAKTGEKHRIDMVKAVDVMDETPHGAKHYVLDLVPESNSQGKQIFGVDLTLPNDDAPIFVTRNIEPSNMDYDKNNPFAISVAHVVGNVLVITGCD